MTLLEIATLCEAGGSPGTGALLGGLGERVLQGRRPNPRRPKNETGVLVARCLRGTMCHSLDWHTQAAFVCRVTT